jgi:hypothetical protein
MWGDRHVWIRDMGLSINKYEFRPFFPELRQVDPSQAKTEGGAPPYANR